MIARWRLAEANKRALKRWRVFHGDNWRGVPRNVGVGFYCWQKYRKVTVPCSCDGCGNPRHHWGQLTWQEMKANLAMRDYAEV